MQICIKYLMIKKKKGKTYKELMKIQSLDFSQPNYFQFTIEGRLGMAQVLLKQFYLITELFQGTTSVS